MPPVENRKKIVFRSARIFDGSSDEILEGMDVLVSDGIVQDVSPKSHEIDPSIEVVECAGRTLMPGLIDAHVHVYAASLNIGRVVQSPVSYLAHFAAVFLRGCLERGFTSVRDVGGADVGLASAIKEGLLGLTPRLYYGGRVLSQTGDTAISVPETTRSTALSAAVVRSTATTWPSLWTARMLFAGQFAKNFAAERRTSRSWHPAEWHPQPIHWIDASIQTMRFEPRWMRL